MQAVLAKIVGEIDRRFVDEEQRLGRSALGINHVMAFELDVVVFQFLDPTGSWRVMVVPLISISAGANTPSINSRWPAVM